MTWAERIHIRTVQMFVFYIIIITLLFNIRAPAKSAAHDTQTKPSSCIRLTRERFCCLRYFIFILFVGAVPVPQVLSYSTGQNLYPPLLDLNPFLTSYTPPDYVWTTCHMTRPLQLPPFLMIRGEFGTQSDGKAVNK